MIFLKTGKIQIAPFKSTNEREPEDICPLHRKDTETVFLANRQVVDLAFYQAIFAHAQSTTKIA